MNESHFVYMLRLLLKPQGVSKEEYQGRGCQRREYQEKRMQLVIYLGGLWRHNT